MGLSKIEWTDFTFNPWIGCTALSPACDNCYAEAFQKRCGGPEWGHGEPRRRTSDANWKQPIRWDQKAAKQSIRYRVFCASLADVFDAEVQKEWRDDLFALIDRTPNLDWLLLTKRPNVARKLMPENARPNVWMGTTVEDRKRKNRIDELRQIPAAVRFLSVEPLLEDLGEIDLTGIGWVIVGGESGGRKVRPMQEEWALSLRDQCAVAGVPFLFKQWGNYAPTVEIREGRRVMSYGDKKENGRMLAGALHDAYPIFP